MTCRHVMPHDVTLAREPTSVLLDQSGGNACTCVSFRKSIAAGTIFNADSNPVKTSESGQGIGFMQTNQRTAPMPFRLLSALSPLIVDKLNPRNAAALYLCWNVTLYLTVKLQYPPKPSDAT